MNELFKIIKGFLDYQVSNYGRVKSLKYNKERILKHALDKDGYPILVLNIFGQSYTKTVHRLVALHFISNPDHKPQINHIDGIKQNNHIDNLEWCTRSENEKHAHKIGLKNFKGENNNKSKLTENEVLTIHGLYLGGMKQKEIAILYKMSFHPISDIVNGNTWKHMIGR